MYAKGFLQSRTTTTSVYSIYYYYGQYDVKNYKSAQYNNNTICNNRWQLMTQFYNTATISQKSLIVPFTDAAVLWSECLDFKPCWNHWTSDTWVVLLCLCKVWGVHYHKMNKCQPQLESQSFEAVHRSLFSCSNPPIFKNHFSSNVHFILPLFCCQPATTISYRAMPTTKKCEVDRRPVSPLEWLEWQW